ncbi:MAG: DUF362 domain-containing protein [Thermoguttaceae bacterium]|jgi:uncharacterized protein (DUF362 family)
MSDNFNRREILKTGIAAAGLLVGAGLTGSRRANAQPPGREQPGRPAKPPSVPVAIQRAADYEPQPLRQALDKTLDFIGGIRKLVEGKTVAVKINVTGGPGTLAGLPGYRTYHVHPNLLAALCGAISDAGARRIVIVESQYSSKTPEEVLSSGGWDIRAIKAAGGQRVTFEDTRNRGAWPHYCRLKVPWGGFVFGAFDLNARYEKTDVMVSLAKLKDHTAAGVTMAVKNLFGIAPNSLYGDGAPNEECLAARGKILHQGTQGVPAGVPGELARSWPNHWKRRVPRITADLAGARPIDLAIVDGIETTRGGEGPWTSTAEPIRPHLLLAGRNAVCSDAISTAAMGYDPQAPHGSFPFPGDNHLLLLAQVGVGAIDPKQIEVRGLPLEKALFPFNPKRLPLADPGVYNALPRGGWRAGSPPEPEADRTCSPA